MKTVGVVIPIYNVQDYLKECLDSVINQTYKNLQVVLVNDGSTDENSLNIAKEYTLKDERFILFDKKNGGQSIARNVGIEYFSKEYELKNITNDIKENSLIEFSIEGNNEIYKVYKSSKFFKNKDELLNFKTPDIDYIIFLDSDDYWELNCIEECVPRMDGVEVVWFKEKVLIETNVDISTKTIFEQYYNDKSMISKYEWIEKQINKDDFFQFVCFGMIDFNFLRVMHLKFENNIVGEDRIFGIILFLKINFIYMINQELYFYRIRDNSICNYNNAKIQKYPKYFSDLFRKCKNIERHIGVYSLLKMLMILIQYCENNKKNMNKKELFLIKKIFIPSFYNYIYPDILKCDKIPIFMKIFFLKIDLFWLEFCKYHKNRLFFIKMNNNILFLLLFLYNIFIRFKILKIKG